MSRRKDVKKDINWGNFRSNKWPFCSRRGHDSCTSINSYFKLEDAKARATSVFAILPMVVVSGLFYYKKDYIDWNLGIKCAIGGIIGGIIGAKLLKKMSSKTLRILFVIFLAYTSIKMIMA